MDAVIEGMAMVEVTEEDADDITKWGRKILTGAAESSMCVGRLLSLPAEVPGLI